MNAWITEFANAHYQLFVFGFSFSAGFVAGCHHERRRLRKLAEEKEE